MALVERNICGVVCGKMLISRREGVGSRMLDGWVGGG